jgi:hypothetical protein
MSHPQEFVCGNPESVIQIVPQQLNGQAGVLMIRDCSFVMKRIERTLAMLLSGLALMVQAWGAIPESQIRSYQDILTQNAFRLKPIPLPEPDPPQIEPPVNILLTGITTFPNGIKKVYLKIPDLQNPNQSLFPCIKEGERDGALEVIRIDEQAGLVVIRRAGVPMTLTFEKNGHKPQMVNFAGVGAVPGISNPGIPPGILQRPDSMPNRTVNLGTPGIEPNGQRQIPPRPSLKQKVPAVQNEQALVQSMVNVELNRELTKEKVATGELPPLPPTDLSESAGPGPP